MTGNSPRMGLFVLFLTIGGFALAARAQGQTAEQFLKNYPPKMDTVNCTTPSGAELPQCKVDNVVNSQGKTIGWKVVDSHGQTLRCFLDTIGSGRPNVSQYFKDGIEIYREIDSKGSGRPDQYRWVNEGGMKWGVDYSGRGRIDAWRVISAEEVAQEAFQAVVTRDYDRLQALFISDADMRSLRLSDKEAARIKGQLSRAQAKFRDTTGKVAQGNRFKGVDGAAPNCVPGDSIGMDTDMVHFPTRTIYYGVGAETRYLQTGEMIQVGASWRLADAPSEDIPPPPTPATTPADLIKKKIAVIDDKTYPSNTDPEIKRLVARAALIEQLLSAMQPQDPERAVWYKQLMDNLAAAAFKDPSSLNRLQAFLSQIEKSAPSSDMGPYIAYRIISVTFLIKMTPGPDGKQPTNLPQIQKDWNDALVKFVQTYPKAEDAPDALRYLAVNCEFSGDDAKAKAWYQQIYQNFPNHPLAETARGSVRRLECVTKDMELSGPRMDGGSYSISQSRGKLVAIYYWAVDYTNPEQRKEEFESLRKIQSTWSGKGFDLVCINLDDDVATAKGFLAQQPAVGIHLFQKGTGSGLTSPLATHYGINGLPTLFLVDKQGKVLHRSLQVSGLNQAIEDAMRKVQ